MSRADNQKPWMDPPDLPPASFDPVRNLADREMLEHSLLPSRPEPALEPELYEHWRDVPAAAPFRLERHPRSGIIPRANRAQPELVRCLHVAEPGWAL